RFLPPEQIGNEADKSRLGEFGGMAPHRGVDAPDLHDRDDRAGRRSIRKRYVRPHRAVTQRNLYVARLHARASIRFQEDLPLRPAALMTFAHLTNSSRRRAENSSGLEPMPSTASAASLSLTSGSASAFTVAPRNLLTIARGVPRATTTPYQPVVWKSYPYSATVGTSGSNGVRFVPPTASARSLPDFTNGSAGDRPLNIMETSPAMSAVCAGAAPLYGTCRICTPADRLNSSPAMWMPVPVPPEA